MTESLPLPITSLLPVLLFPMLGIMDTETTTTTYMKESSIMVIGEIFLAEAVEHCNLHMRIAYGFIMLFGPSSTTRKESIFSFSHELLKMLLFEAPD